MIGGYPMRFKRLRALEKARFWFIILIIQIPSFLLLIYLGIQAYIIVSQNRMAELLLNYRRLLNDVPLIFKAWGLLFILTILFSNSNIFSLRSQYIRHIQNLMLIDYYEQQAKDKNT